MDFLKNLLMYLRKIDVKRENFIRGLRFIKSLSGIFIIKDCNS